jgi:ATP-dependent Lon protease
MNIFKKSGEKKAEEKLQAKTIEELGRTIAAANMPPHIQHIANNELEMLSKISPATAEYTIGLTYVDYLVNLPWNKKTEDSLDLKRAEKILNEKHHGLQKVKERILEHLAVKILMTNKKSRILVVDDEEIARKNLEHILKKENYTVITAASGAEAIEMMEASDFDVVLTDIRMEKVDGIQVLEKAKSRYPDSKVIMITGYASVDSAIETLKKGAFHYIAKPFKIDEIRVTVKQAIAKKLSNIC